MGKFFLTNKAIEDLSNTWEYTFDTSSENQGDKYYNLLIHSFQTFLEKPEIGKDYSEINTNLLGLPIGKHIIFYRRIKTSDIEILRILHQKMDLRNRLAE